MYVPAQFQETDPEVAFALMERHGFATLVTQEAGGPVANHFPLLIDRKLGPHGTILGHMARSNPQWRSFVGGQEALVLFQGPHTYVSPSWYGPGLHVPTWNYAAVHAFGTPRIIDDPGRFLRLLEDLIQANEAGFENPWRLDLPADERDALMNAIVGFEIPIARVECKLKLSQNRSEADRRKVMEKLCQSSDPGRRAVGELMRETARS